MRGKLCIAALRSNRLLRFLGVGALNSMVGYGIYAFLLYAGLGYHLALLIATILGVLFNFKTTGRLVFQSNNNSLIIRFICVYVVIYLVNALGIKIFAISGINEYVGGLVLLLPVALLGYMLNKNFVFK